MSDSAILSPVMDVLRQRASVRDYKSDNVSDDMLDAILTAARQAPTSSNLQAYSFVVARNRETK